MDSSRIQVGLLPTIISTFSTCGIHGTFLVIDAVHQNLLKHLLAIFSCEYAFRVLTCCDIELIVGVYRRHCRLHNCSYRSCACMVLAQKLECNMRCITICSMQNAMNAAEPRSKIRPEFVRCESSSVKCSALVVIDQASCEGVCLICE